MPDPRSLTVAGLPLRSRFGAAALRADSPREARLLRARRPRTAAPLVRGGGLLVLLALAGFLAGCGDPGAGPVAVKWDREVCDRCRMVLSDRHHSAQVRVQEAGQRSRVMLFDDIGCAVIWLEDKPWRDDPATEIWVTDWRTGDWIDARTAVWVGGQVTPMEYGLGAQSEPAADGLDFAAAKVRLFEVEKRFNVHGGDMGSAHAQ